MSFVIKGYVSGEPFYENNTFKMYGFFPNNEYLSLVNLSDRFGNITIKGELPTMVQGKEYELEVEYEKKGKYESYVVKRFLSNPMDMNKNEAYNFLSEVATENQAENILKVYPDFVKMVIENKTSQIDVGKIYRMSQNNLDKIIQRVNDNVMFYDIISEFKEYDLTLSQVQKIYMAYKSFDLLKEKMNENPYRCLCSVAGIGFRTADVKILNKNRSLATSEYRMAECIFHILKKNEECGNTWMRVNELYSECSNLAPQCMRNFKSVLTNDNMIYYDSENGKVGRKSVYYCEQEIAKRLFQIQENSFEINIDYSKYDTLDGFKLTDKQKQSAEYACKYNFYILSGFAGSGKTSSTKALINMLDDNYFSYVLLSPTGKAAKNLSLHTGKPASTIHRGLRYSVLEGFEYNENNKLPYDFVIVDEATMVDVFLMRSLLRAIDKKRTKLILICDQAQIPSVGCGNCIQDIINSNKFPVIFLDTIFRYKDGGLAKVATDTRNGKNFIFEEGVQKFSDDFVFVPTPKETLIDKVVSAYKKLQEKTDSNDDIKIVSAYNVGEFGTYNINSIIQDIVNPSKGDMELSYVKDKVTITFRVGDIVMQTRNNYKAPIFNSKTKSEDSETTEVFNGDDGKVVEIGVGRRNVKYMVVDFDGKLIYYKINDLKDLVLGYAISGHKSQGSQYKYVVVVTPPSHKYFLNRNLLYVMYTRAMNFVYNIGTADTISSALKKSENLNRQTFLSEILLLQNTK